MTDSDSESLDRVMVIAAHPDDPEFGCAGTVVKWAQTGKRVTYVLLTSGDKGSHDPDLRPGRLAARARASSARPRLSWEWPKFSSCAIPTASWRTRWLCAASWPE